MSQSAMFKNVFKLQDNMFYFVVNFIDFFQDKSTDIIKQSVTVLLLNIVLPTIDIYSDLYLIVKLLYNGHPVWSVLLLVPFLLNYFLTWFLWWRIDKTKHTSWVYVALSWYPQFCALKVIGLLLTDTKKGLRKKRKLELEISEFEVFCEAVMSVLVMTYIIWKESGEKLLIGEDYSTDFYLFYITYLTSILTASLGLAKCLKVGPCRVFPLGGLCNKKFFFLMFTMGTTLVSKGMLLGHSVIEKNIVFFAICFSTTFLPGLIIGLMSVCRNKKTIKTIAAHPSILLLPVFTYFTFSTNTKMCSKGEKDVMEEDDGEEQSVTEMDVVEDDDAVKEIGMEMDGVKKKDAAETRITFSKNWTLANVGASVLGYSIFTGFGVLYVQAAVNDGCGYCWDNMIKLWFTYLIHWPILSVFSTILFLFLEYCCCSCSKDQQFGVLCVDDPHTEYVVDKYTKEIITMEDWEERQDGNKFI